MMIQSKNLKFGTFAILSKHDQHSDLSNFTNFDRRFVRSRFLLPL